MGAARVPNRRDAEISWGRPRTRHHQPKLSRAALHHRTGSTRTACASLAAEFAGELRGQQSNRPKDPAGLYAATVCGCLWMGRPACRSTKPAAYLKLYERRRTEFRRLLEGLDGIVSGQMVTKKLDNYDLIRTGTRGMRPRVTTSANRSARASCARSEPVAVPIFARKISGMSRSRRHSLASAINRSPPFNAV
jgi:hypothetical protein